MVLIQFEMASKNFVKFFGLLTYTSRIPNQYSPLVEMLGNKWNLRAMLVLRNEHVMSI